MSNRKHVRRSPAVRRPGSPRSRTSQDQPEHQDLHEICRQLLADLAADVRLIFSGHPALRQLAIDLAPGTGSPASAHRVTATPIPVALIEPARTGHVQAVIGRSPYDVRTAIAAKLGLPVLTDHASGPPHAENWTLHYGSASYVLTDPTGLALARCTTVGQSDWRHRAEELGQVVVIYGPRIGVQRPSGTPPDRYDTRAAELSRSQANGMANWGIVRFITK